MDCRVTLAVVDMVVRVVDCVLGYSTVEVDGKVDSELVFGLECRRLGLLSFQDKTADTLGLLLHDICAMRQATMQKTNDLWVK